MLKSSHAIELFHPWRDILCVNDFIMIPYTQIYPLAMHTLVQASVRPKPGTERAAYTARSNRLSHFYATYLVTRRVT